MPKAVVPYVISDLAANMPVHILSSGTFTVILYFMCGLRKDDLAANLFIFIADNVLVQLVRPIVSLPRCPTHSLSLGCRWFRIAYRLN
jgi:hypothetical protein